MRKSNFALIYSLILLAGCAQFSGFFGPDATKTLASSVYGELIFYKTMATEDLKAGKISVDEARFVSSTSKEFETNLEKAISDNDIGMIQSIQTAVTLSIRDYVENRK